MRIIHAVGPKETFQMTASGFAFCGPIGHEHEWRGWHCELLITSRDALTGAEQAIEIEGKGEDVIHALKTAYMMLEGYGAQLRKQFEAGVNVNPPHQKVCSHHTIRE